MSGWRRLTRGVNVPMESELNEAARSRRWGILLTAASVGFIACFALVGRTGAGCFDSGGFGIIPLAVGLGFFVDFALIRRDAKQIG